MNTYVKVTAYENFPKTGQVDLLRCNNRMHDFEEGMFVTFDDISCSHLYALL